MKKFNSGLHPRGLRGRFRATPDQEKTKPSKVSIKKLTTKQKATLSRITGGADKTKQTFSIPQSPGSKVVLSKLDDKQKAKLREILERKAKEAEAVKAKAETSKPEPTKKTRKTKTKADKPVAKPTEPKTEEPEPAKEAQPVKTARRKRQPTLRKPVKESSVVIDGESIEIWKDNKNAKPAVDFKVRTDKKYEYGVNKDGVDVVLNRHHNVLVVEGEVVKGVPSLHPRVASDKTQTLTDSLARCMSYVESSPGTSPPAPDWKPTFHGAIDKKYLRTRKGEGLYGEMQIHHVDQWSKTTFASITKRRDDGEITTEQAQEEMRKLLQPVSKVSKDGKESVGYEIAVRPTETRQLVILAAGSHDINSPLFKENHPLGIHPDTGKLTQFGIPKDGEGGRKWFDTFRAKFWTEYYRREAFILRQELNSRLKKGEITSEELQNSWKLSVGKVDKAYQTVLDLRKAAEEKSNG